jgi:sugar phosphate isomerase/epimerase
MKYSFATLGCPNWTIDQIVTEAKRMGYDGVELRTAADGNHIKPDESPESCEKIKERFARDGIAIAALMGYTNFADPDEAVRTKSGETAQSLIKTAAALGCPIVRFFGGDTKGEDHAVAVERIVASLKPLVPVAEKHGVKLAFETHDAWVNPANLMQVLDQVPSPSIGVCWDIANTSKKYDHKESWDGIKARVIHVHAKDIVPGGHECVLPGTGAARLSDAVALLRGAGYNGYLSFEWEKKWQAQIAEPEVAFPAFIKFARGA